MAAVVGFLSAVATLVPRLTVEAGSLIDSSDPLSVPFTITNTNILPLEKVGTAIGVCRIRLGDRFKIESTQGDCSRSNYAMMIDPKWQNHRLAMDEAMTIVLRDAAEAAGLNELAARFPNYLPNESVSYSSADVSVIVMFRPWILPLQRRKEFRFTGTKQPNGGFIWQRQSIDRPS